MQFEAARNPGRITSRDDDEAGFLSGFDLDTRRGKTHLRGVFERHHDGLSLAFRLLRNKGFGIDTLDNVHHESNVHGQHGRLDRGMRARGILSWQAGVYHARLLAVGTQIAHDGQVMYVGEDFEQLRLLLWNRQSFEITEEEALDLYEANRQWVEPDAMSARERQFFEEIVARYGGGVFLG